MYGPVLVDCLQFYLWYYSPQFCQDRGVELLRDLYKIQWITGPTLISFVKMPKTQVRSFPDSSSHRTTSHLSHLPQFLVSEPALTLFISDRSRLSFSQSSARLHVVQLVGTDEAKCYIPCSLQHFSRRKHFSRICSQIFSPLESHQTFKVIDYEHCAIYSVFRPFLSSRL